MTHVFLRSAAVIGLSCACAISASTTSQHPLTAAAPIAARAESTAIRYSTERANRTLFNLAIAQSDSALSLDSTIVSALVARGVAFAAAGRPRDAAVAYRRALALNPDYPRAADAAIGQFWRAGYYDEAFKWGKRQAALEPANVSVLWNYQVAAAFLIEPALAESLMVRALEVNPRYVTAHGELAFLALYAGRTADAVSHMESAFRIDSSSALTRGGLAQMLIPAGQAMRARDLLAPIISRDSSAAAYGGRSLLAIYGWALKESGDSISADRAFEAALNRLHRRRDAGETTYQLYREMAAIQALEGKRADAIESLSAAAAAGMHTYATWDLSDPMFASLRGDRRVELILDRMRADTRRMRAAVGLR